MYAGRNPGITVNSDIVWPAIAKLAREKFAECAVQGHRVVALEAAVLIESGWYKDLVDEVWVVYSDRATAVTRIKIRNPQFSEEDIQKRIDAQISNEERLGYATVKIENNGTKEQLEELVKELCTTRLQNP